MLSTETTFAGLELATQLISHQASIFLGVIILGMNKPRPWKCPWTSSKKRKKRTKNENTAMNEQAKVDGKLKVDGCLGSSLQKIESRVSIDKGALMIVHVLSGWLASSYPIRRAFLQHISWRVSVESVINKRKSSSHFAWRNGSIAVWMFVHPIDIRRWHWIERLSYQSKIISINIRISPLLSRGKVKHVRISEIAI